MASLDGAVALPEADGGPAVIDEDLRLDVPHALEVLLEVDAVVAEGAPRLRLRLIPLPLQLGRRRDLAHAAPAPTGARFEHHRIADGLREPERLRRRADRRIRAGNDRHADLLQRAARLRFVMETRQDLRRRPDEHQAVLLTDFGEIEVLREEPVSGMDGLGPGDERGGDDRRDIEIGVVDREAMCVSLAVDDDARDPELAARADDAQRDLAAVRDEHLIQGQAPPPPENAGPAPPPRGLQG